MAETRSQQVQSVQRHLRVHTGVALPTNIVTSPENQLKCCTAGDILKEHPPEFLPPPVGLRGAGHSGA